MVKKKQVSKKKIVKRKITKKITKKNAKKKSAKKKEAISNLVAGFCGRRTLHGCLHLQPEGNFSVAFASLFSQGRTFKNLGFNPKRVDFFYLLHTSLASLHFGSAFSVSGKDL